MVNTQVFASLNHLNLFHLLMVSPKISDCPLSLSDIQKEMVVPTPRHKAVHQFPVLILLITADTPRDCRVIRTFHTSH